MKKRIKCSDIIVGIKSGGDIASGVAWRLHHCGFRVFITETDRPLAVRRKVAFCEAVYDGKADVEGIEALLIHKPDSIASVWNQKKVPLLIDPDFKKGQDIKPDVLIDGILAKKNIGTTIKDAPLVIALGPGFEVGKDCHFIVETNRGHNLGRILTSGAAESNTGIPGAIQGFTHERVLRAPSEGVWKNKKEIGDLVEKEDLIGTVEDQPVKASINGVIRGMIRPGLRVSKGLKIGDIDPRRNKENCYTISEKALAIAGGVLEGILRNFTV